MKVLLKYSTLTLVILCLYLGLAGTFSPCHEISSITQEAQFTAHYAQNTKQAVNNFYNHCPEMPCDIVHYSQDIPASKYIIRSIHSPGKTSAAQELVKKKRARLSLFYSSDSISYYVFGLRKIIV